MSTRTFPPINGPIPWPGGERALQVYHIDCPVRHTPGEIDSMIPELKQVLAAPDASVGCEAIEWWGWGDDYTAEDFASAYRWRVYTNRIWPPESCESCRYLTDEHMCANAESGVCGTVPTAPCAAWDPA